jgi:hypothetical protein
MIGKMTPYPLRVLEQNEPIFPRDYPPDFDFIHTRMTIGCWSDMRQQIIKRAFDHLRPGGWLECQEMPVGMVCDDDSLEQATRAGHPFVRWEQEFNTVSSQFANRQTTIGPELKPWMEEAGFVDVKEVVFKIPINGWPKDPRLKHIGMLWQKNLLEGMSGFSLGLFHRFLGKSVEEIEVSFFFLPQRAKHKLTLTSTARAG